MSNPVAENTKAAPDVARNTKGAPNNGGLGGSSVSRSEAIKKFSCMIGVVALYIILSNITPAKGLSVNGWRAIVLMICALITWVTEFIPIGISACFLLFFPQILGIESTTKVLQNFAISTVFFIISSMIIAGTFIDTGLAYRISLYMTALFGKKSKMVLLSFMLCATIISSVLADIPTAIILAGIAYPLLEKNGCKPGKSNFGKSVMVGIPISAAIGGIATPAGSGLNVLTINLLKQVAHVNINFLQWTLVGAPMAIVMLFVAWFIITKIFKAEIEEVQGLDNLEEQRKSLGKLSTKEKKFAAIFVMTLVLWFTQPLTNIDTTFTSLLCTFLFFLPKINLTNWKSAQKAVSWDSILLVGSANALAMVLSTQGSAKWLSNLFLGGLTTTNIITLLFIVTTFGILIHLLVPVGNAVLSLAIPIITVFVTGVGINPLWLILPLGMTAACVFMIPLDPIPLSTYGYRYWKMSDMPKVGVPIAVLWIPVCVLFVGLGIALHII